MSSFQKRQTCDRCQQPPEIECADCAMMMYSQSGDTLQAMQVCQECDRLLHQISYKANHKRTRIGERKSESNIDVLRTRAETAADTRQVEEEEEAVARSEAMSHEMLEPHRSSFRPLRMRDIQTLPDTPRDTPKLGVGSPVDRIQASFSHANLRQQEPLLVSNVFQNTRGREEWLDSEKVKRLQTEPEEDTMDRKLAALNPQRAVDNKQSVGSEEQTKEALSQQFQFRSLNNNGNEKAKNYQSDFATMSTAQKNIAQHFEFQDIESFRAPGPSQPDQKPRVRLTPNEITNDSIVSQQVVLSDTAKVNAVISESDKLIAHRAVSSPQFLEFDRLLVIPRARDGHKPMKSSYMTEVKAKEVNIDNQKVSTVMEHENLRAQIKSQNQLIGDLRSENQELKYHLDQERTELKKLRASFTGDQTHHQQQLDALQQSLKDYQGMLEELMKKHAEEIKKIQRLSNQQNLADKDRADDFTDRLKRQHGEVEHHMREKHSQLERDKKLQNVHIEQLTVEVDHLQLQLERMEQRLERQVLVDQNIEKELQDELAQAKAEIRDLEQECQMLDDEYLELEKENNKLAEVAQRAKGTSDKLERIVYGQPGSGGGATAAAAKGKKTTRKRRVANGKGKENLIIN